VPLRRYFDDARLAGSGRLTWFGLRVYDAALFAPRRFDPADAAGQAFGLVLTYARRLDGKGIANASRDEIQRLGFGSAAQRARWHERMLALFPDVDKGRRLTGIHVPRQGARFYFDDEFIGAIEDPEFARAFFAIWLDERTRAPQLRESLLKSASAPRPAGS
jgi:Chalcone isomerase-like